VLNKHNFAIAAMLPQDDEVIAAARGLYVSPERTIETDGHHLIMVTAPQVQPTLFDPPEGIEAAENWTPFMLDRETALKIAKAIPKRNNDAPETNIAAIDVSTEAGENATVAINELVRQDIFRARKIDADKYPDVDKLIPDRDDARILIAFNADLIADILKIFQKFAGDAAVPMVIFRLYEAGKGMRIDAEVEGQNMTAYVMPMRTA